VAEPRHGSRWQAALVGPPMELRFVHAGDELLADPLASPSGPHADHSAQWRPLRGATALRPPRGQAPRRGERALVKIGVVDTCAPD